MPALRGPDGKIVYLPDDEAQGAIANGFTPVSQGTAGAAQSQVPVEDTGALGGVTAASTGILSGLTFGGSDVALKALLDKGQGDTLSSAREQHPWASGGGQLAGAVLPSLLAPELLLARSPAGLLSRAAAEGIEGGKAIGGAAGLARQLAVQGGEGAIQNAGAYISDTALGNRDLTAEGMAGALGMGFGFGAGAGAVVHGVEAGTIAARRMFARVAEGGEEAASDAAAAWQRQHQETLDAYDQTAELARAKLVQAKTERMQAGLARDQAAAGVAETRVAAPQMDAAAAQARVLDENIGKIEAQSPIAGNDLDALNAIAGVSPAEESKLTDALSEHDAARSDLDSILRNIETPDLQPLEVPVGEFGAPGAGGFRSSDELARMAAGTDAPGLVPAPLEPADATRALRGGAKGTPPAKSLGEIAAEQSPVHAPAITIDSPIEQLSLNQLKDYRALVEDTDFDSLPYERQQELFSRSSAASKRIRDIESGQIKEPSALGAKPVEKFTRTDRAAGGSQGGSWYSDDSGQQWFGKHYGGDTDRLWGEHVANQVYRKMGVSAPETEIVEVGGKPMLMSKEIPGSHAQSTSVVNATDIHHGFVVDAWLGNRDVIGAAKDNVIIAEGKAHRIDAGGATIWRAQGEQKTFVQKVSELESMRSPERSAGRVFGQLSKDDVHRQLTEFASRYKANRAEIDQMIDSSGLSREARDRIKTGLHDRAAWLETEAMGKTAPLSNEEYVELAGKQHAQLSPEETSDLLRYSGSPLFRELNGELKAGKQLGDLSEDLRATATNIDAAISRSEMPRDSVVYRGVNSKRSLAAVENLKPGDVYEDHGFGSTSRERSVAERLSEHGTGVSDEPTGPGAIMEISVPKGFPALPVPSNTYGKRETELLLPRGARYIVTDVTKDESGARVLKMAIRQSETPAATDSLTGLLRGTQSKLAAGEGLSAIGAPARAEYAAAKAERTAAAAEHFRSKANGERTTSFDIGDTNLKFDAKKRSYFDPSGKAMESTPVGQMKSGLQPRLEPIDGTTVRKLEIAHDAALERAAAAVDPAVKHEATAEAAQIEQQLTAASKRPGAVEDVAAVAPAITRYEKASAVLTEALGDAAPPSAQTAAKAYREAEATAERKTMDRTTRAIDQHAERVGPDRRPEAMPSGKAKVTAAKADKLKADAVLARARTAESEAGLGARAADQAASDLRASAPAATPTKPASAGSSLGDKVMAGAKVIGVAGELGVPGVPHPKDIPVIGPLLDAYVKYRMLKATAGRFVGRVPATANTKSAALAARTKDKIATAVDRSLGLVQRNMPTVRVAALAAGTQIATALRRRAIDDGLPDAPKEASITQAAAVRIREVAAVAANPQMIIDKVRAETRDITDPDLLSSIEQHQVAVYQYLNDTAPKAPPPNPYSKREWEPSQAAAMQWGRRLAVANDPTVAFDALHNQTLTPEAADALNKMWTQLFTMAQQRLIAQAKNIKEPVDYAHLLRASLLFGIPLDASLEADNSAVLRSAFKPPAPQPQPQSAPGGPPVPSIAAGTNLTALYQTTSDRRAQR